MSLTSKFQTMSLASKSPHKESNNCDDANECKRNKTSKQSISSKTKRAATRKIERFLRRNDPRVRSKFLQSVCSDSGVCIAFGKETNAIRKHFDYFRHFRMLSSPAIQIGKSSSNGFVKELTYSNRGYNANAVLKSVINSNSDNFLYEALVGFFINRKSLQFPTFVETYGLYQYNEDNIAYNQSKSQKSLHPDVLINGLKLIAPKSSDIDISTITQACKHPTSMALLIQHLKGAKTLHDKYNSANFVKNDLIYVLFHIYMTLSTMANVFTHYDLHTDNVLIYEPVVGSCIEYHYHINGEEIVFKSPYIAKIIDYGRCYFHDDDNNTMTGDSKKFYKVLCEVCEDCGYKKGFSWLEHGTNNSYISSQVNNPSHDLRLLYLTKLTIGHYLKIDSNLSRLLRKVVYGNDVKAYVYGTKSNPVSGFPDKINNVTDAFLGLLELVKIGMKGEDVYKDSVKLGELHVYDNGRMMRYIASSPNSLKTQSSPNLTKTQSSPKRLSPKLVFTPINKTELKDAINNYIMNNDRSLGNINTWDVSLIKDMSNLFKGYSTFNEPINNWNVSNVTNMEGMFDMFNDGRELPGRLFNQRLDKWDVSNVTKMNNMFSSCSKFNQRLDMWDVSKVENMEMMFSDCDKFNQPLNNWGDKVKNVKTMKFMFAGCYEFNQPLDKWNVSGVTNMENMFMNATSFDQPLNMWDVSKVKQRIYQVFEECPISDENLPNLR